MSGELVHLQKSLDWEYIEAQSLEVSFGSDKTNIVDRKTVER